MGPAPARFEREIAGEMAAVADLLAESRAFLESESVDDRAVYTTQLALEELLTNVVKHGSGDGVRGIACRVVVEAGRVAVEIADDGVPFDPVGYELVEPPDDLADRRVGGLGLRLVRRLADELSYRRDADRNVVNVAVRRA